MMQMDYQRKQQYVLTGEIRLLEKQKRDISLDLERLESSKKAEYSQYTQEIKDLTKRRNDLLEQIEQLKDGLSTLTDAYTKSKQGMEVFVAQMKADAQEELRIAKAASDTLLRQARTEKYDAELLLSTAKRQKIANEQEQLRLEQQAQENMRISGSLVSRQRKDAELQKLAEDRREELTKKTEKLTAEIEELQERRYNLETLVIRQTEALDRRTASVEEAEKTIAMEKKAQDQRAEMLERSEQQLREKAQKLDAQAQAIHQVTQQLQEKGVSI